MRILVLTDNPTLYEKVCDVIDNLKGYDVDFFTSTLSGLGKLDLKDGNVVDKIINEYDMVLSLHSQQIFPTKLFENVRCVNIHPGFNPYNRGWYPHVFSFINNLPVGVTIHEINGDIDAGDIIYQERIEVSSTDTSLEVYQKILELEKRVIGEQIKDVFDGNYKAKPMGDEGNLNFKKDYLNLCELDMTNVDTFENHINILRALSHGDYKNAFFFDKGGEKVYVKVSLTNTN